MTTQQIGYFIKLAEELNYTRVAQEFFITQPTLSKQIVNLENELNVTLFNRNHNSVELTKAGKKFYTKVKPAFAELMKAVRYAQSYEDERETLLIGIQEEQLVSEKFYNTFDAVRSLHPELKLSIHRVAREELLDGLYTGKFDIINVLSFPASLKDDKLIFEPLEQESAYLAYSPSLMQLDEEISKLELTEILEKYNLILPAVPDAVDSDFPKKLLGMQMSDLETDKLRIKPILTVRPISVPIQVTSRLGVALTNKTNILSVLPGISFARIADTEGSFCKGLMCRKNPDSPYVRTIVDLTLGA